MNYMGFCHSERSEESRINLIGLRPIGSEGRFASLNSTQDESAVADMTDDRVHFFL